MVAFLTDEALALRLHVEQLNASSRSGGAEYEAESDLDLPAGPLVPGPAAHLVAA